jgi:hypothetical protein
MSLTEPPPHSRARLRAALSKIALKAAFGAAFVVGVLGAGQAQALIVTVDLGQGAGPQKWNVTTFTEANSNNLSKFNTLSNGGVMPWWTGPGGSDSIARAFATAVGFSLGSPSLEGIAGPFFGYRPQGTVLNSVTYVACTNALCTNPFNANQDDNNTTVWAQADLVAAPGPLPVFGAAAAFGFSRKLRKRIKATKGVGGASVTAA